MLTPSSAKYFQPQTCFTLTPGVSALRAANSFSNHDRFATPDETKVAYGYVSPSPYGPVGYGPVVGGAPVAVPGDVPGYDEGHPVPLSSGVPPGMFEDEVHLQRLQSRHPVVPGMASPLDDDQKSMRWRDPNLSEVIGFLSNPNNIIKANAAAYLQHLCYMDDPNKQKTRSLGGIPPLVQLLDHDNPDVYRNACGALRNLSYGRQNDENKRAIKNAGGVPALINLLRRTSDADVKELVTGVLWNLSSCEVSAEAVKRLSAYPALLSFEYLLPGSEEVHHRRRSDDGGEQYNHPPQWLGSQLFQRRDLLVHRLQERFRRPEKCVQRRGVREEEIARMRGSGRRVAVRGAVGHREVQYRQQDRGELRVHPEKSELSVSGGRGSELRQASHSVDGAEQGGSTDQR